MLSFWARYVLLKEGQGVLRETTLAQIEESFGQATRQEVETELSRN